MMEIKSSDRVLFIGDSITDVKFNKRNNRAIKGKNNFPLQVTQAWKKKGIKPKVFYRGIASNRTYHVYDRFTVDCINLKPSLIVMLIGVNDAWENYVPDKYPPLLRPLEPHLTEVFRRIKAELPEAKLIFMTPFLINTIEEKLPFHKVLDSFNERIRVVTDGYADVVISLQEKFTAAEHLYKPVELAIDGVHPTELGHSIIARAILDEFNI